MWCNHRLPAEYLESKVYNLFVQYIIVGNKIGEDIKRRIPTTAGNIPEGLNWKKPFKRRIKEINHLTNALTHPC